MLAIPAVPPKVLKYTVVLVESTGPLISSVKVTEPSPSDTDIEVNWKPTPTVKIYSYA